jgi:asparagine N-glycosylation enzyme membrane subunit Stt3
VQVNGFVFIAAIFAFMFFCLWLRDQKSNTAKIGVIVAILAGLLCLGTSGAYAVGGLAIGVAIVLIARGIGRIRRK